MENLTPSKVRKITLIVMLLSVAVCFLGYFVERILFLYIGMFAIMVALIFHLLFYRCHTCGKYLGRDKAKYCPHCGSEVVD